MKKIKFGIMGTAKIGREKVIPALQAGKLCEVNAIASRELAKASQVADQLGIAKAYGSYEALLQDADIDAIYIPLPNHLHVPWALKCLAAGKHVLCEKPIGLSAAEATTLLHTAQQYPHLKVMEAFMYRFHPQWQKAKELVDGGSIGELKTIQSFFSYFNDDPTNIRNQQGMGGGGLMDIGCYNVSLSRFLFGKEPLRVIGLAEYDKPSGTDRLTSALMDFENGQSGFTCSTQLTPYQKVNIFGTKGRVELEIPFNAPANEPTRIWLHNNNGSEVFTLDATDQYTVQGDAFATAILNITPVPTPLQDAVNNMKVIESIFESSTSSAWVKI